MFFPVDADVEIRPCIAASALPEISQDEVNPAVLCPLQPRGGWQRLAETLNSPGPVYIYLRAGAPTLLDRVKHRGRHGEQSMPLTYMQSLTGAHERWLMTLPNVRIVDAHQSAAIVAARVADIILTLRSSSNHSQQGSE